MKKLLLFIGIVLSFGVLCFVGCGTSTETDIFINMVTSKYTVDHNQSQQIEFETNYKGKLIWQSSDESVATVDSQGIVTSKSKDGRAEITVSAGEAVSCCLVIVAKNNFVPVICIDSSPISLFSGATLERTINVTVNNEEVDAEIIWASEDESIATVTDGKIFAIKEGNTNVLVTARYRNAESTKIISVKVVDYIFSLDKTSATIYTDSLDGRYDTSVTFGSVIYNASGKLDVPVNAYLADKNNETFVSVSGYTVSAASGFEDRSKEVQIIFEAELENNKKLTAAATLTVLKPVETKNSGDLDLSDNPYLDTQDASLSEDDVCSFSVNGRNVPFTSVSEGKVYFSGADVTDYGEQTVELELYKKIYRYRVKIYSFCIDSLDDFKTLLSWSTSTDVSLRNQFQNGYIVLSANIDCNGYQIERGAGFVSASDYRPFMGHLDGRGYTISGFKTYEGIFYEVGGSGIIENIGLDGTINSGSSFACGLVARTFNGVMKNCSLKACFSAYGAQNRYSGAIAAYVGANFKVIDCIVVADYDLQKRTDMTDAYWKYAGALVGSLPNHAGFSNVYVITNAIYLGATYKLNFLTNKFDSEQDLLADVNEFGFSGEYWYIEVGKLPEMINASDR